MLFHELHQLIVFFLSCSKRTVWCFEEVRRAPARKEGAGTCLRPFVGATPKSASLVRLPSLGCLRHLAARLPLLLGSSRRLPVAPLALVIALFVSPIRPSMDTRRAKSKLEVHVRWIGSYSSLASREASRSPRPRPPLRLHLWPTLLVRSLPLLALGELQVSVDSRRNGYGATGRHLSW